MLEYHKMTEEEKYCIARWKYPGEYAIYNSLSYEEQKKRGFGFAENGMPKGMQRCPANSMGEEADFAGVVWMGEDGCSDHRPPRHKKSAERLRIFYDFPLVFFHMCGYNSRR